MTPIDEQNSNGKLQPPASPGSPKVGLIVVAVVVGMLSIQLIQRNVEPIVIAKIPGPGRGDVVLLDECLPTQLGDWKKTHFTPALEPEDLQTGQVAWSHSWTFNRNNISALVSFDQADFQHWHDLCVCYEATGWTVSTKKSETPTNSSLTQQTNVGKLNDDQDSAKWPYVVAHLKNSTNQSAILVFSLFFDDGDPVDATAYQSTNSAKEAINRLMQARFDQQRRLSNVASLRQCQVFMPYAGQLSDHDQSEVISLHLISRNIFRNEWMKHWLKKKGNDDTNAE